MAIWDAFNGVGTGASSAGSPPGWSIANWWSATSTPDGHAIACFSSPAGVAFSMSDTGTFGVVLQVL